MARHSISIDATVREAFGALNALSGRAMTLFAVNGDGTLAGSVTDGDLRRAILRGASLESTLRSAYHANALVVEEDSDRGPAIARGRSLGLDLLPVTSGGKIVDLIDLHLVKASLPIDAVLMAGGRGERLRPLTDSTPKPLLPVGGQPIIDYNVSELRANGVKNIFVTVNYLAEQIEDHFKESHETAPVVCVREPRRLGTIGSLTLVEGLKHDHVLLMNSDLLTNLDFEAFYWHHVKSGADITMAAIPYNVSVPYALMRLEDGKVKGLEEKPTYNYFANAGVYLIRRGLLGRLRPGEYADAPDFISDLIADGGNVGCFPIDGTWIDIGSPDDYRYANELMKQIKNQNTHG